MALISDENSCKSKISLRPSDPSSDAPMLFRTGTSLSSRRCIWGKSVGRDRRRNPPAEALSSCGYYHLDPSQCFFTHLVAYHCLDCNTRFRLGGENLPSYIIAYRNACSFFMLSKIWQCVVCYIPNGFSKERCLNVSTNYRAVNFENCLKLQSGGIFGIADFPEWH